MRTPLAALAALAFPLLLGATGDGCAPKPNQQAVCTLQCEHGLKHDSQGRAYCECLEGDACIAIVAPPSRNPVTGECVLFPTVCDIPQDWKRCGPGCRVNDRFVPVGESIPAADGCNTCACLPSGGLACSKRACPVCEHKGTIHAIGDSFPAGDGCNRCTCLPSGRVICSKRPCMQCPPPDAQLCERSGGRWDPGSCGHYACGELPLCDAIIPGCDCGPDRSFRPGLGCVSDPACGACRSDADCAPGSACNACPPDPDCPACAVCGPPRCEAIVCAFDPDCPRGSHCEGSSVCPPDVVCIWQGEPGICVPDSEPAKCCDPSLEPGVGGNPFCFEGASCCADGSWSCNRGDLTSTCEAPGRVCE